MDRQELLGADGVPVATYARAEHLGLPLAHAVRPAPGAAPAAVAEAVVARLGGWVLSTDAEALLEPLVALGAELVRDARTYSLVLGEHPPARPVAPPEGSRIGPLGPVLPPGLGALNVAAYGPGHPDHDPDADAEEAEDALRPLVEGGDRWRPLSASRLAVREADGAPLGAAILAELAGAPPTGGPWVAELFKAPGPATRGLGAALLDAALDAARADGLATVGLTVTVGNPAVALYERRGFGLVGSWLRLQVPGGMSCTLPGG